MYNTGKTIGSRGYIWHFKCDCGNECEIPRHDFVNGRKKTCGRCYEHEMIGRRFGKLTVISLAEEKATGRRMWNCRCDCGKTCIIDTTGLTSRNKVSCGCHHDAPIGERFGRLTVLGEAERRGSNRYVHCRCDCGNECDIHLRRLKSGGAKSCGHCMEREMIGKVFGKLTVVSLAKKESPYGKRLWNCQCKCGNTCLVSTAILRAGRKRSCGCLKNTNSKKI